ncbi:MAG: two-component sensor histidine kinase [Microbacterium sp. SCN 70-27]|uniref:sensor histidine kinase n=1 Tax=unclassified Microbacterium TaxID=2609290 RepID=UPI00086916C7|nr:MULTISPECIES: HAMP domain-containing sensor histidine kinase [unclassified Microbacterium]MBN9223988.1 HAMP domain-containing histidine kinase [Microbacterium sp.]ODT26903.1 MAG: two-component sensor histidine kinase [Microbacterium sp. SCN 70-27]
MSASADQTRVRRAALRIGVLVGVASALVITVGVAVLVTVLLVRARPENPHEGGRPGLGGGDGDRVVVDLDDILPWVIALGLVGVVVLAVVAWAAARRAVRPLADALQLQRAFVADASHEMRTPLTALSARVQMLQRRRSRGEPLDETIDALRGDVAVMDEVLTDMLLVAEGTATDTPGDVATAVAAAARTVAPLAHEAAVEVVVDGEASARVRMSRATLTRVCVALLDNAIQHAPAGSRVSITARTDGHHAFIRVADDGPGIAEGDRVRIFERFARGGEAGRRRGFGLGLALVRDAAVAIGGTVAIESTSPAGTTFLLTLPRAD